MLFAQMNKRETLDWKESKAHRGCAGFEEPVEAEAPGVADGGLELVPGAVAQLVHHAQDEAVLLLCIIGIQFTSSSHKRLIR